eukprot:TRINITY_DN15596_c0_g3_i1.p1 TRINITY_DN15596_c0_g3~~TRINITY_DN15596_c0_g3_i1.p1  ORF type:complete len:2674 (+),score=607.81 TRINITY_DN15596_c0_g3_i1:20-8041(+)
MSGPLGAICGPGGSSSSSSSGGIRGQQDSILVQVRPKNWPLEALGPSKDGWHWRHAFWLRQTSSWKKLVAVWCREHGLSGVADSVRLLGPDGLEVPLHETPASSNWLKERASDPLIIFTAAIRDDNPDAQKDWDAAMRRAAGDIDELSTTDSLDGNSESDFAGLRQVRVTAACEDGTSAVLRFRISPQTALRKLMAAWCSRQGVGMSEVRFSTTDGQEVLPASNLLALLKNERDAAECVDIVAQPGELQSDCTAEDTTAAAGKNVKSSSAHVSSAAGASSNVPHQATSSTTAKAQKNQSRAQMKIIPQGDLVQRLAANARKLGKPAAASLGGGLSLWTKMLAPLGKVIAAWCKHHGLVESEVLLVCNGKEVRLDETAASRGWGAGELVILTAILASDHQAKQLLIEEDDGRVLVRVVDSSAEAGEPIDFRMRAFTSFERMMWAWREQKGLPADSSVQFELLPGSPGFSSNAISSSNIISGELKAEDTPNSRGWSAGGGALRVRASLASAKPVVKYEVKVVSPRQDGEPVTVDFKMGHATPFRKMMRAWCEHNSLPAEAAAFSLDGRPLKPDDSLQSLGLEPKGPITILACQAASGGAAATPSQSSPASNSQSQEAAATEKIDVDVVAMGDDGENIVSFKMKLNTAFEKMMTAWCKHHSLELSDAIFDFEGRHLRLEDSPLSCGWSLSKGKLVIKARPREDDSERQQPAAAAAVPETAPPPPPAQGSSSSSGQVSGSAQGSTSATGSSSASASDPAKVVAGGENKILVQVVAHDDVQRHTTDFKMRLSMPFSKMMKAWCQQHELQLSEAIFEFGGRELKPEETPASCGWSESKGVLLIEAKPREEQEEPKATIKKELGDSQVPAVPARPSPSTSSAEADKIQVDVVAWGEDGKNVSDFKMKLDTPFSKMMQKWCEFQELDISEVIFQLGERELCPEDTPAGCGWSLTKGKLEIEAKPVADSELSQASASISDLPPLSAAAATASSGSDAKIDVKVRAVGDEGENVVDFRMKLTTAFAKMMTAWCTHQGLSQAEALFEFQGRELKPEDTPASCGWSLSKGVLWIDANPRDAAAADAKQSAPAVAAGGSHTPAVSQEIQATDSDEKINIQVKALGEDGENIVDFKMKFGSPFEKMMRAWCKHQGLALEEVLFEFQGQRVRPEDTPQTMGWAPSKGTMVIDAKPHEDAPAENNSSQPPPASGPDVIPKAPSASTGSSAASSSLPDASQNDEKVKVQVIASDEAGEHSTDFRMKLSSPFEKMMKAWCQHHEMDQAAALFEFQGKQLRPQDTPLSCGWSAEKGTLMVTARPAEGMTATKSASSEKSDHLQGKSDVRRPVTGSAKEAIGPNAGLANSSKGAARPSTAVPASDGKLDVDVKALGDDGENVTSFKMKLDTPFAKMMTAWCQHHGLEVSDAVFECCGKELGPNDCPASLGWSLDKGKLEIQAKPREDEPASTPSAGDQSRGIAESSASQSAKCAANTSASLATSSKAAASLSTEAVPASDGKLDVDVKALGDDGENVTSFKMKLDTPFAKMMTAWCQHHGLEVSDVVFEGCGRELGPNDCPASLGWSLDKGKLVIQAKPREDEPASTPSAAKQSRGVAESSTSQSAAASSQSSSSLPDALGSDEKTEVRIKAMGPEGENVIIVKMKSSTPFEKMMTSWCGHHGISLSDAVFQFQGRDLQPEGTLESSCGWSSSKGPVEIWASPREQDSDSQQQPADSADAAQPGAATPKRRKGKDGAAVKADAGKQTIEVRVIAAVTEGDTVANVKMKLDTPFEKMMAAWCKRHDIPRGSARFELAPEGTAVGAGRELSATDTPARCGWSSEKGVLMVRAMPRDSTSSTTTTAASSAVTPSPTEKNAIKTCDGAATKKDAGSSSSAVDTAKAEASVDDVKMTVEVHAEGENGTDVLTFKMKRSLTVGKFMSAWCGHHNIPLEEVCFTYGKVELKADQTLSMLDVPTKLENGEQQPLIVHAAPREATEVAAAAEKQSEQQPAAEQIEQSSQHLPSQQQQPPNPTESASTESVNVQVIAHGQGGNTTLPFKMKPSTTFGKMMSRWCKHYSIPEEEASFYVDQRELKPDDSPASLNWVATHPGDELTVLAQPKGSPPPGVSQADKKPSESGAKRRRESNGAHARAKVKQKRAASAYMFFSKKRRPEIVASRPELKNQLGEIQKLLAAEWKALAPEDKKPFEEDAEKDRQRCEVENAEQNAAAAASDQPEPDPDVQISVRVLAQGEDGPSELAFKMKISSPLSKVMQAWCDHHEIPMAEAAFLGGNLLLRPEDTAASMGHTPTSGDLVLHAVPRNSTDAERGEAARLEHDSRSSSSVRQASGSTRGRGRGRGRGTAAKRASSGGERGERKKQARQGAKGGRGRKQSDDENDGMQGESEGCWSDGTDEDDQVRRSQRLKESPAPQGLANITLVHHPPAPARKKQGEATVDRMSWREYLEFDRKQDKLRAEARRQRQQRKLVNGDSSDEDLQMAMAMSISESQLQEPASSMEDTAASQEEQKERRGTKMPQQEEDAVQPETTESAQQETQVANSDAPVPQPTQPEESATQPDATEVLQPTQLEEGVTQPDATDAAQEEGQVAGTHAEASQPTQPQEGVAQPDATEAAQQEKQTAGPDAHATQPTQPEEGVMQPDAPEETQNADADADADAEATQPGEPSALPEGAAAST